jgi:dihydrofolate synthase/folylpolyglutamate synthase
LPGRHQFDNAGTSIACLDCLDIAGVTPEHVAAGLRQVDWPARLQRLTQGPLTVSLPADTELWLDGAHNQAGGEALAQVARGWHDRPLSLVFGMLESHDARAFLQPLAPLIQGLAAVAIPGESNARSATSITADAQSLGISATTCDSMASAVRDAARPGGRVLICGSLYLAGAVLAENG